MNDNEQLQAALNAENARMRRECAEAYRQNREANESAWESRHSDNDLTDDLDRETGELEARHWERLGWDVDNDRAL